MHPLPKSLRFVKNYKDSPSPRLGSKLAVAKWGIQSAPAADLKQVDQAVPAPERRLANRDTVLAKVRDFIFAGLICRCSPASEYRQLSRAFPVIKTRRNRNR